MYYKLEIQKLLVKAENLFPHDKINLLKQAAHIADANGDTEWGYELRLQIMDESTGKLKDIEALPSFAWILEAYDAEPGKFDAAEMLWKYKWMIDSSARCHFVSVAQLERMLDDYGIRLTREGFGLRSYFGVSASVGFITENLEKAKLNLDARDTIKPDVICDTPSRELYDRILYCLMTKDTETAFALEHGLFSLADRKALFPIDCGYAEYLIRCGETQRAKPFIDRAERIFAQIDDKQCRMSVSLGGLIYALTFTDVEKAWLYVSDYINWIRECQDYDALVFGMNILPLLKRGGKRTLRLSHEFPIFRDDNLYDAEDLFDYFYATTLDLTERFDARNGNDAFKKQLNELTPGNRGRSDNLLHKIVKRLTIFFNR